MRIPLSEKPMQDIISHLLPQATIQQVQVVSSIYCQRAYGVRVSDGTSLVLVSPPPPMVKLLRSERSSVLSEAAVLKWLTNETVDPPIFQEQTPEPEDTLRTGPVAISIAEELEGPADYTLGDLGTFLPVLMAHAAVSSEPGREYNLMKPILGDAITDLSPPLSQFERKAIDFQTGQFYRRLCKLVSPTGRFGPAFAVLPPATSTPPSDPASPAKRDVKTRMIEPGGLQSWSTAFHSMLEAVLRDGEDMQVMLGYGTIRRHFKRFQYTMEEVKTPRLVAVDIGKDLNTLVLRKLRRSSTVSPASSRRASTQEEGSARRENLNSDDDSDSGVDQLQHVNLVNRSDIIMAGMKDWSNFIFGDPLFAIGFSCGATSEFILGFNSNSTEQGVALSMFSSDMIEDKAGAHVRLLLYECYHTVTHIAREFFRPRRDSGGRELEARRKLNNILAQLDALDDGGIRRGRRPSGEVNQAKRFKNDGQDD